MGYKSHPRGIRQNYTMFALDINIQAKKSIYSTTWLVNYQIKYYLENILHHMSRKIKMEHRLNSKQFTRTKKRTKNKLYTPIILGMTHLYRTGGMLFVELNYYLNLDLILRKFALDLFLILRQSSRYLSKLFKLNVKVLHINYYLFIWKCIIFNEIRNYRLMRTLARFAAYSKSNKKEYNLFNLIYMPLYQEYLTYFKWALKNTFAQRVLPIIFVFFFTLFSDATLLANSFAYELQVLRKNHKYFLTFCKKVLKYCYKTLNLWFEGIEIIFKGRLTLKTRQTRRKQKKFFLFGKISRRAAKSYIDQSSALAINRFGVINIKITYQRVFSSFSAFSDVKNQSFYRKRTFRRQIKSIPNSYRSILFLCRLLNLKLPAQILIFRSFRKLNFNSKNILRKYKLVNRYDPIVPLVWFFFFLIRFFLKKKRRLLYYLFTNRIKKL